MGQNYSHSEACEMERCNGQRFDPNKQCNTTEAETASDDSEVFERPQPEAQAECNDTEPQKSATTARHDSAASVAQDYRPSISEVSETPSAAEGRTTFFSLPFELRENIYNLISTLPADHAFHANFRRSYQKEQFALTAVNRQFREDILTRYYRNVKVIIWSAKCGDYEAKVTQDKWLEVGGKHVEAARKFQFHVGVGCVITFEGTRGSGVKGSEVEELVDGLSPVEKRLIEERVARTGGIALRSEDIKDLMDLLEAMQGGGPGWS